MRFTTSLAALVATFTGLVAAAPIQERDSRVYFICDSQNSSGTCYTIQVTNNVCTPVDVNMNPKSINEDDQYKSKCQLYATGDCTGYTLPCSGDCGDLFVFDNNLRSLRCTW